MKYIKTFRTEILLVILLGLVFILWARILGAEMTKRAALENLYTTEARVNALSYYGWEADAKSESYEIINIPSEFDEVYIEYNRLQRLSGFDLTEHRGKAAERYTYLVTNFPADISAEVFVNILIRDFKIIGGDCMTTAIDGFMLPLDRRFAP